MQHKISPALYVVLDGFDCTYRVNYSGIALTILFVSCYQSRFDLEVVISWAGKQDDSIYRRFARAA